MWDMRCVNTGSCSLSKGTQSDGLISDTSTEDFTSDSSTENLKEGRTSEKSVAKEIKQFCNESQHSVHSKPSTNLHRIQSQCQLYIRWGLLLSFGILLWVALWIADIFRPNPFLKEDVTTAKKVTLKAGTVHKPEPPSTWWCFNLWNYAYNSINSATTTDILIFLSCITIVVYLEAHVKNNWLESISRLCYDQLYKSLRNTAAEENESHTDSFHLNVLEEELLPKESKVESCCDDLSIFNHGDVRNLATQDGTRVELKLGEKRMQYLNQEKTLSIEERISKSRRSSHNMNSTQKRSLYLDGGTNYCNFSGRNPNLSEDVVTNELILNGPDLDMSCVSSKSKDYEIKSVSEQSNLRCSIFNKSTSFMSEEIETWFELPNSDQAERMTHSFDMELKEFFTSRRSLLPVHFRKTTQDLQRINDSSIGCKCDAQSKTVVSNIHHTRGIVSSSPAFRRFLMNLPEDHLSEPYL